MNTLRNTKYSNNRNKSRHKNVHQMPQSLSKNVVENHFKKIRTNTSNCAHATEQQEQQQQQKTESIRTEINSPRFM